MNMKIEKISDNQIRCTLTRADLAERQLQFERTGLWNRKSKITFPVLTPCNRQPLNLDLKPTTFLL